MDSARKYYDDIKTEADILNFVNQRFVENTYVDFTTSPEGKGKLSDSNKEKIREAASGFAHQEGGIVVWGIVAVNGSDGDYAQKPEPIKKIASFLGELENFSKYAVSPQLSIEHKLIYRGDNPANDDGYAVSYFPKSEFLHVADKMPYNFYRRFGSSFMPMVTENDVRSLVYRNRNPQLELRGVAKVAQWTGDVVYKISVKLYLKNIGRGVAKYPSILVGYPASADWFDGAGSREFRDWSAHDVANEPFKKQLMAVSGFVIHPEQEIFVGELKVNSGKSPEIPFKCFAEDMIPVEGTLTFPPVKELGTL